MNKEILNRAIDLKLLLDGDKAIVALRQIEAELTTDENVSYLSFLMNNSSSEVEYLEEKGASKEELSLARRRYSDAKKKLYELPIVKEYNASFRKVRDITDLINKQIFQRVIRANHVCG